ncbi:type IV secretory system conjugative DNA transfer family protein (plasmid) [Rhizobium sp. CB3171]|uniref:type IV secretory system conjugative DNA transfer family protein n=1 Tax=Rhizobium sp. CB3171 TaxID=3039157 RepID=UPI0024B177C7|nr:type IV secretory system conjugative DNA transfer family protein [Rhizobium sp. CB3171]WFU07544.1 type IV secretory system conjugative DNA transfer family protein [Rhizobium sp. CB3171]
MDVFNFLAKLATFLLRTVFKVVFGILAWCLRRLVGYVRRRATTFGTARWARFYELLFGGVLGGKGIIVGRSYGRFLRFNKDGYVLLFAPTRSGKGAGVVIPNLLTYQGSIICTDPKGENHAITGRYRSTIGKVVTLNATNPHLSDMFNPLDMVRVNTFHEADDALQLAKLLVIPDTTGGSHWDNRATQLLQGLVLYTCLRYADIPELRNLSKVRNLVSLGWGGLGPVMEEARTLGSTSLREIMEAFRDMDASDEARSILSNADKAMSPWSADRPAGMISTMSTFDFRDFNRETITCYLVVDEEKLPIYREFLRVMMGSALTAMTRVKHEPPAKHPTFLLMDECAAMGRIEPLETGVGYLASYARMLLVFQDLDQLKRTYPKASSMIANAGCKIAFGVSDIETARMLADTIGQTTVRSSSRGKNHRSESDAARMLKDPSEILRMPFSRAFVFFNGRVRYPVLTRKIRYYKMWRWMFRWDKWRKPSAKIIPFPSLPDDTEAVA